MNKDPQIFHECQQLANEVTDSRDLKRALSIVCYNFFTRLSSDVFTSKDETLGIQSVKTI